MPGCQSLKIWLLIIYTDFVLLTVLRLWGEFYILRCFALNLHSSWCWDWLRTSSAAWSSWICLFSQHHASACLRPTVRQENRTFSIYKDHLYILLYCIRECSKLKLRAYLVWTFVIEYKSVAPHFADCCCRRFNVAVRWLAGYLHSVMSPYSVFGVDVCAAVNEMLSTLAVSRPHSYMERSAVQLRKTNRDQSFQWCKKNISRMSWKH